MIQTSLSLKKFFFATISLLVVGVLAFAFSISKVNAAAGDFELTVNDELGTGLAGATVTAACPGGASSFSMVDAGAGVYTAGFADMQGAAADCQDTEAITFNVSKAGYVTSVDATTTYDILSDPDTYTLAAGVEFSHKVTPFREVALDAVTGATVTVAGTPCTESAGEYYCAVPVGSDGGTNDIFVGKTGYVSNSSGDSGNRTLASNPQSVDVVNNVLFQVKICLADQLGNTYPNVTTTTFDGNTPDLETGGCGYYARTGDNLVVSLQEPGFIDNEVTNTGLGDVSASPAGQTDIQLGDYAASAAAISANSSVTIMGMVYNLKSDELFSEIGTGAVATIADGFDVDGTPSADVTITASAGETIQASAVSDNAIYIAYVATGDTADTFTVQVQNVTVDGGTANGANLVAATIADPTDTISATTVQLPFDIHTTGNAVLTNATGFEYPLVVDAITDELGNSHTAASLNTNSYDNVAAYYTTASQSYFANTGTNANLLLAKSGYIASDLTNAGGLDDITTDQALQTTITLDNGLANAVPIVAGDTVTAKGLEFVLKSNGLTAEPVIDAITSIADGYDASGGAPSADVVIVGSNGATIIASQVAGDVIYIAATGDAGTDDTVSITLSNVTVGGLAADSANMVIGSLVDSGDLINGAAGQVSFDFNPAGGSDIESAGFKYPLKVIVADELGTAINIAALDNATYNGAAPYTSSTDTAYFAPVATADATVNFYTDGYVGSTYSNDVGLLLNVDVDQTAQTVITMGANPAYTAPVLAGESVAVRGLMFGQKILIESEVISDPITGATVTAGSMATACIEGAAGVYYCAVPVAEDDIETITIEKDGYVTHTAGQTGNRAGITDAQIVSGINDVQYSHVVTYTREGDGAPATGMTVNSLAPITACVEDGSTGMYYCPITVGGDGTPIMTTLGGYEGNMSVTSSDRSANTDAQVSLTTVGSVDGTPVQFVLKVVVTDELGNAINISDLNAITFDGNAPDYDDGANTAYWAVEGSNLALSIQKDGYVANEITNAGITDVTTNSIALIGQTVVTLGNGAANGVAIIDGDNVTAKGLQYAVKVTAVRQGDNSALDGATVTAGNSFGTSCTEDGATGIYYCGVPLADTGVQAKVIKSGYNTTYGTHVDRTVVTDAQRTLSMTVVPVGGDVDVAAPTATGQTPADDAVGVSVSVSPTLSFSEDMDASTINNANVQLRLYSDDSEIDSVVTYNSGTDTAIINPTSSLEFSTQYYIYSVNTEDAAGNVTSTDYDDSEKASHEFTTDADVSDTTNPTVNIQTPADDAVDVAVSVSPTIEFSEAMNAATLNSANIQVREYATDVAVSATVLYNSDTNTVTVNPVANLGYSTQYYLYISGGTVEDESANALSHAVDYSIIGKADHEFTTAAAGTGSLAVTSIDSLESFATADDTYANGFIWDIHATIPTDELAVSLRFSDFLGVDDSIPAENVRYCSEQSSDFDCADDGEASTDYVEITNNNIYTDGPIAIDDSLDLDADEDGIQVILRVMMKVPSGTAGGSYSGSYGLQSV